MAHRTSHTGRCSGRVGRGSLRITLVAVTETAVPSAHLARRLAGFALDYALSLLVASAFFTDPNYPVGATTWLERAFFAGVAFSPVAIWALQHLLLVATLGTTIGHRVVGLRVLREDGTSPVGFLPALIRTALLVLVIPAVVWDGEGRGLHDKVARTRIVRTGGAR